MEKNNIEIKILTHTDILPVLQDLARLRIIVFRDWPYLYDGTLEYEEKYLKTFAAAKGAVVIAAYDGKNMIGASTGAPMIEHADEFGDPFQKAGYDIQKIFYCGESVLLKTHRGLGLGHVFFDGRENHARKLGGFKFSTFCRVIRPESHPLKPADYSALDPFWKKRGYTPLEGIIATYKWKDIDQTNETIHNMQFWIKAL